MDDLLNLGLVEKALTDAGYGPIRDRRKDGTPVLDEPIAGCWIFEDTFRGCECITIKYINPDGHRGTAHLHSVDMVVALIRMRRENFAKRARG